MSCEHIFIIDQTPNNNTVFCCVSCKKVEPVEPIKDLSSFKCNCVKTDTNNWKFFPIDNKVCVYCSDCIMIIQI